MSDHIPEHLRRLVTRRSTGRCEYCGLSQQGQEATFHVDHVVPRRDGGETMADNLALACVSCSLRKAARRHVIDPESGEMVELFHPRRQQWSDHFQWEETRLIGVSATGRATISALRLNRALILAIREEERRLGRHPPS